MSKPILFRPVAILALAAGLFLALPGCGGNKPQASNADDKGKKDDPKVDPKGDPKGDPKLDPPKAPQKVDLDSGAGKEAVAFLKALGEGTAKADRLSSGFTRAIGLPAELPGDKTKGYSTDAAEGWLKRVGGGKNFNPPSGFAGTDAAVLWGPFSSEKSSGGYLLRMIKESGAWKVDYLVLTSANYTAVTLAGSGPDADYQRFAVTALAGALCDKNGMPKDDRALAIAAGMAPELRAQLAEPFGSDKDQGFNYNRGKLLLEADKIGGGVESYSVTTPQNSATDLRLEVAKFGGAKSSWLVKLKKGGSPGQWLVESINELK